MTRKVQPKLADIYGYDVKVDFTFYGENVFVMGYDKSSRKFIFKVIDQPYPSIGPS
jgi:hypothetical protein